jgi:hypothetical protein
MAARWLADFIVLAMRKFVRAKASLWPLPKAAPEYGDRRRPDKETGLDENAVKRGPYSTTP